MVERSYIEARFSKELQWIRDPDLRIKVVELWITAADISG